MRFTGLSEFVVYGLLFAAIIGFNILKQVLGGRRDQKRRQARAERPAPQPASQPEPMETQWGRTLEPEPVALAVPVLPLEVVSARERESLRQARLAAAAQEKAVQQVARAGSRRRLFRTREELRQGIVLMTVLGPCRALQPHDQNHG